MKVVYAKQEAPKSWKHAIFLCGPTPRDPETPSWRPQALKWLKEAGYDGVVFVPEDQSGTWAHSYIEQVEWEKTGLELSDRIVFWVPRDLVKMPAFTTNVEFGRAVDGGKVVLGFPEGAEKTRYLDWMAGDADPDVIVVNTLEETLAAAIDGWEDGPMRSGGERYVPRLIWDTPMFQAWYDNLKAVGNRLDQAKVKWIFTMPKARTVFSWVLWVKVWINEEGRFKENEFVLSRTDISVALLYHNPFQGRPVGSLTLQEILGFEVVLVKEFRSPGRTPDGFIHELPGGSSTTTTEPQEVVKKEVHEETGMIFKSARFIPLGSRQVAGTLSSHHASAFAVELTGFELASAKRIVDSGDTFGEEQDSELTYVEVTTVEELLEQGLVDWSTLGILFKGLLTRVSHL